MNKLIAIGLPVISIVVIIIIVQLYENIPESPNTTNQQSNTTQSNTTNQQSNTTQSKPVTGKHITVDLNESLAVTSH